ncbi:hypothetical protein RLIN73S_01651 [Rhodanobacter lindaniclasticus]
MQVATNPGRAYNPLLLYGGTGLRKTYPDARGGQPDAGAQPRLAR